MPRADRAAVARVKAVSGAPVKRAPVPVAAASAAPALLVDPAAPVDPVVKVDAAG
jgi:hypothetical protein